MIVSSGNYCHDGQDDDGGEYEDVSSFHDADWW